MRRTSHKGRPRCPQVSGDELPPQFCAEGHWFKCWVQRILQPQVCVIHGRQGMVRMYSTLTKAPKHAVVVISELLVARTSICNGEAHLRTKSVLEYGDSRV